MISGDVPGPDQYETANLDVHRKRAKVMLFDRSKSPRLEVPKRDESTTDFYELEQASKKTNRRSPSAMFFSSKKKSFA